MHKNKHGIDYGETFSQVVKFSSVRALIAFAVQNDMLPYSTKLWREKTLADLAVHCQSTKVLSAKTL